jgi:hypothetical protein
VNKIKEVLNMSFGTTTTDVINEEYERFKNYKGSLRTKDEVQKEIIDYLSNKDYCYNIYDCSREIMIGLVTWVSLKIKIKNYPISLILNAKPSLNGNFINGYISVEINIISNSTGVVLNKPTYNITEENYLEKLDEYIKNIIEAYTKYKEFIQDINNHIEEKYSNTDVAVFTMVDLNQYYLYCRYNLKTVVVRPSFEVENGRIITIAYIGNDNSHYPSKVYVNSANMEDVYDTMEFFL